LKELAAYNLENNRRQLVIQSICGFWKLEWSFEKYFGELLLKDSFGLSSFIGLLFVHSMENMET